MDSFRCHSSRGCIPTKNGQFSSYGDCLRSGCRASNRRRVSTPRPTPSRNKLSFDFQSHCEPTYGNIKDPLRYENQRMCAMQGREPGWASGVTEGSPAGTMGCTLQGNLYRHTDMMMTTSPMQGQRYHEFADLASEPDYEVLDNTVINRGWVQRPSYFM